MYFLWMHYMKCSRRPWCALIGVVLGHQFVSPLSHSPQGIDQDTQVAFEDQQKINLFARKNIRLVDLKEQISAKEVSVCAILTVILLN